jgi:hypothetical protein
LCAAADPKSWYSAPLRRADKCDLPPVSNVGQLSEHRMRRFAVRRRVYVCTSCQHERIHTVHQGIGQGWIVQRHCNSWYELCVLQCCQVAGSQASRLNLVLAADRGANRYNWTE